MQVRVSEILAKQYVHASMRGTGLLVTAVTHDTETDQYVVDLKDDIYMEPITEGSERYTWLVDKATYHGTPIGSSPMLIHFGAGGQRKRASANKREEPVFTKFANERDYPLRDYALIAGPKFRLIELKTLGVAKVPAFKYNEIEVTHERESFNLVWEDGKVVILTVEERKDEFDVKEIFENVTNEDIARYEITMHNNHNCLLQHAMMGWLCDVQAYFQVHVVISASFKLSLQVVADGTSENMQNEVLNEHRLTKYQRPIHALDESVQQDAEAQVHHGLPGAFGFVYNEDEETWKTNEIADPETHPSYR